MKLVAACLAFALLTFAAGFPSTLTAQTTPLPTPLRGSTQYPRLIRIEHGPPQALGHILASTTGRIFESDDEGQTFRLITRMLPAPGLKEICCATLYELPRDVGSLQAGTLLYATSDDSAAGPSIDVYASSDQGLTWSFHSTVKHAEHDRHGLWEPAFSLAADGALVVFWSDETDSCCSQKLVQKRTYDGRTWSRERDTVRSGSFADRPGMITVARLPSGTFFMTYEICGRLQCGVFARTSKDGWNYGHASDLKQLVRTPEGAYFTHAPQSTWVPAPDAGEGGGLLVIGQVLHRADGSVDTPHNGHVLFRTASPRGEGPWTAVNTPIDVPDASDDPCPNYSSALLSTQHGAALLELASDYNGRQRCVSFFATRPWGELAPLPLGTVAP